MNQFVSSFDCMYNCETYSTGITIEIITNSCSKTHTCAVRFNDKAREMLRHEKISLNSVFEQMKERDQITTASSNVFPPATETLEQYREQNSRLK